MLYVQKATQVTFSQDEAADYLADLYAYPEPTAGAWVRANMIATIDGAASVDGTSGGLGGDGDKTLFTVLRGLADVVLVGARTAIAENYRQPSPDSSFAERRAAAGQAPAPALALVSRSLSIDPAYPPLRGPGTTVLTCSAADPQRRSVLADAGASLVDCGDETVDFRLVVEHLAAAGQPRILCEGGPSLLGSLIAVDALDELCLTTSPYVAGGDAGRVAASAGSGSLHPLRAAHVLTDDDGYVFSRWTR